jgi:hypothetical protein
MRFLNLIMGLVTAHRGLWSVHQTRAISLDFVERSAKATASRIDFNSRAIFSNPRGRPRSNAELSTNVREDFIYDKSTSRSVIAALALAMTGEKADAMLAVGNSDPSYMNDILCVLSQKQSCFACQHCRTPMPGGDCDSSAGGCVNAPPLPTAIP